MFSRKSTISSTNYFQDLETHSTLKIAVKFLIKVYTAFIFYSNTETITSPNLVSVPSALLKLKLEILHQSISPSLSGPLFIDDISSLSSEKEIFSLCKLNRLQKNSTGISPSFTLLCANVGSV